MPNEEIIWIEHKLLFMQYMSHVCDFKLFFFFFFHKIVDLIVFLCEVNNRTFYKILDSLWLISSTYFISSRKGIVIMWRQWLCVKVIFLYVFIVVVCDLFNRIHLIMAQYRRMTMNKRTLSLLFFLLFRCAQCSIECD